MGVEFVVEHAGCSTCAQRVRDALMPLASQIEIEIDEAADLAYVRMEASPDVSGNAVGRALVEASTGSGHEYRIRPGSWHNVVVPEDDV